MTDRPSSQDDLFGAVQEEGGRRAEPSTPLAARMRPRNLDELVGQDAVVLDLIVRITGSGYQRLFAPVVGRMKPPSR